jgi:predicted nucleotidyltransferase
MTESDIVTQIQDVVTKLLGPAYQVRLFGSRTTHSHASGADVDLIIEGPAAIPLETFCQIRDYADELPTLKKVDVVDANSVAPSFIR